MSESEAVKLLRIVARIALPTRSTQRTSGQVTDVASADTVNNGFAPGVWKRRISHEWNLSQSRLRVWGTRQGGTGPCHACRLQDPRCELRVIGASQQRT
jgi:hypothetical protein